MNTQNSEVPVVAGNGAVTGVSQNTNLAGGLSVASAANGGNLALANGAAAEALGMIMIAKQCPRNELECLHKIENACARISFAENSQYELARGGTSITGPTVGLIRALADYWGNILSGAKITSSNSVKVTGYAYAWDMETNRKVEVPFDVPLIRYTKKGSFPLTNPDDIRYLVNNYASRSERTAIERVLPIDIVQFAIEKCAETQKANVSSFDADKMLDAFSSYGVTKDDIEVFCQRKVESLKDYPGYIVRLRKILTALKDGVAVKEDFFKGAVGGDESGSSDARVDVPVSPKPVERAAKKRGKTVEEFLAENPPVIEPKVGNEETDEDGLDLSDVN